MSTSSNAGRVYSKHLHAQLSVPNNSYNLPATPQSTGGPSMYEPMPGELVWVRDRESWKMGVITSEKIMYKLPGDFGHHLWVPSFEVEMFDIETKEWTRSQFIPAFGEIRPMDRETQQMMIDSRALEGEIDYSDPMIMCQMEKMRRRRPRTRGSESRPHWTDSTF